MAPEIALSVLKHVRAGGTVVDPMMGSGTVIRQATAFGLDAIGVDMDPLAVLMSRVWSTPIEDRTVQHVYDKVAELARYSKPDAVSLPWIDSDKETSDFVRYWFGNQQIAALRRWCNAICILGEDMTGEEAAALDVIKVSLSRIIVTKGPCASLARDTSHSRPHRVILDSDYCVDQGMAKSTRLVRQRLINSPPPGGATVIQGDARCMPLDDCTADAIVTSPPYLNAIDYLRGHRLSLVWFGYKISQLRAIRSSSIGSERSPATGTMVQSEVKWALGDLAGLPRREMAIVDRYIADLVALAVEVRRVIKPGGLVSMVVGDSTLRNVFVKNSAAVDMALRLQGMSLVSEVVRDLPSQSRYLPTGAGSALSKRMRQEKVLTWSA